jgi:hypothetical protein
MREGIWDSNNTLSSTSRNEKDLPFIDVTNEEELLVWLNNDLNDKYDSRKERLEYISRLERMYEGEVYDAGPRFSGINDMDESTTRRPSSIFNYMNNMAEAKMSQRAKNKSAIQVIPAQADLEDENKAEAVKSVLTAKAQEIDIDTLASAGDKSNFITGCSYTYVPWNRDIGPINPLYTQAQQLGVQDINGIPLQNFMYLGDLDTQVYGPDRCFHQLGNRRWADVEDITLVDFVHIEKLKYDYPEIADKIQPSSGEFIFISEEYRNDKYAMVGTFYRRPTKYMPNGAHIRFTRDSILSIEIEKYPYKDNLLPVVYDTDIDLRDSLNGKPFLSNIDKLQRLHDMTSSSMARGIAITNSPKWFYQKGSVDPQKLGNNYSSVEVRGPIEPKLVSFNGLPVGGFQMLEIAERGIQQGSVVSSVSMGEPPKQIESAVALQFLNEQETSRESLGMAKRQARVLAIYKMILSRMQQYYTPQDGRIFRYLGEDNSYLVQSFEKLDISGSYDIRFENSSSLPDTKSGRIAAIMELNKATQADPMFNKEAIAQMLDLGNDKRFRGESTAGLKAAQFKLQQILDQSGMSEPKPYDDFLVEYPIFIQALRQREYKGADDVVMSGLTNYVKAMEYLMWEKARMNPAFALRAMAFPTYPVFFKIPMTPPQPTSTQNINVNKEGV